VVDIGTGAPLGSVEVEVRANLDKLSAGFAQGKQQADAFERNMKGTHQAAGQFINDMVTVNQHARKMEDQQISTAAQLQKNRQQILANAQAWNTFQRSLNPAVANQRLVRNALADVERQYQKGAIGVGILQRAQQRALPWLEKTEKEAKNLSGSLGSGARGLSGSFISTARSARFLISALGISFVGAAAANVVATLEATASLKDQAAQVGLTTKELQEYRIVAGQAGMASEDMDSAFKALGQNIEDVRLGKVGPFSKLIQRLGVDVLDSAGKVRPASAIFSDLIDKLGRVGDEAQRRGAQEIAFGEAGAKMGRLVAMGSSNIDNLREALAQTGMVMDERQIQQADVTAKKLHMIKEVLSAKYAAAVVENASAIETLANAFGYLAEKAIQGAAAYIKGIEDIKKNGFPVGFGLLGHIGGQSNMGQTVSAKLSDATVMPATPEQEAKYGGKPKGGNISLAGLLAPKGAKGRKAPENEFNREELREREEHLRLLHDQTGNLEEQNRIDKELIDIDFQQRIEQLKQMVDRKSLTKAQAAKLQGEAAENVALQKEAADRKLREAQIEQRYNAAAEALQLEQDALEIDLRLARTDKERERVDLAILSAKQEQERAELEKAILLAKEAHDEERVAELTDQLARLRANQLKDVKAFAVEHLTGMAKFKNDLPATVDEINESISKIRFDLFTERLQRAATMAEDVGDAFGNAAGALARFENPLDVLKGLISDLAKTFTENTIEKPIAEWATKHIGIPAAKQAFGKDLTGPDTLTVQEMNVALGLATQNLNLLQAAALNAANAMGVGGAGAAGAADSLAAGATGADQALQQTTPQIGQFGNSLISIISSLSSGGGGGGAGGFLGLLKLGLSIAGAASGGGGGSLAGLASGPSAATLAATPVGINYIPGGVPGLGFAGGGEGEFGGLPGRDRNILAMNGRPFLRVSKGEKFRVDSIASSRLGDLGPMGLMKMLSDRRGGDSHFHFGDIIVPDARDDRSARRSARQVMGHVQRGLSQVVKRGLNQ
jgi:hypothetical protein